MQKAQTRELPFRKALRTASPCSDIRIGGHSRPLTSKCYLVSFDVTQFVRDWADGTFPDNGLTLVHPFTLGGGGLVASSDSKENAASKHEPVLHIAAVARQNLTPTATSGTKMKIIEPPYSLLDLGNHEWRFQESPEMETATFDFDAIHEHRRTLKKYGADLRRFLVKHPNHIDALHHYASCLSAEGKTLEALAFSEMAVATAMRAFPKKFSIDKDKLPTGFVQNRPFLRALHGLMLAQRNAELIDEAITTGQMCLTLDVQDRMGAREELVVYLLEDNRDEAALALFERPDLVDTFFTHEYLHALVLIRLKRELDARKILRKRIYYAPQIARFLLDRKLSQPTNDEPLGLITSGSEIEGWMVARRLGPLWWPNKVAMRVLREESKPCAKQGWKRFLKAVNVHVDASGEFPNPSPE